MYGACYPMMTALVASLGFYCPFWDTYIKACPDSSSRTKNNASLPRQASGRSDILRPTLAGHPRRLTRSPSSLPRRFALIADVHTPLSFTFRNLFAKANNETGTETETEAKKYDDFEGI